LESGSFAGFTVTNLLPDRGQNRAGIPGKIDVGGVTWPIPSQTVFNVSKRQNIAVSRGNLGDREHDFARVKIRLELRGGCLNQAQKKQEKPDPTYFGELVHVVGDFPPHGHH
jgi:hypothetical protein